MKTRALVFSTTWLHEAAVADAVAQSLIGHSSKAVHDTYISVGRDALKKAGASWNTAKERRQHQPSNPQPSLLGLLKPGAAYRERPTAYRIPSYKVNNRNLIVAFVLESSAFLRDPDTLGRITQPPRFTQRDNQLLHPAPGMMGLSFHLRA